MDFFFPDPSRPRLPPDQVRVLTLDAEPYPDGERVRVRLSLTPFEKSPHLELILLNASGESVEEISIIEPMGWTLELTLHVRPPDPGAYRLQARLFYPDGPQAEPVETSFDLAPA